MTPVLPMRAPERETVGVARIPEVICGDIRCSNLSIQSGLGLGYDEPLTHITKSSIMSTNSQLVG
jgi:hypothetical protein